MTRTVGGGLFVLLALAAPSLAARATELRLDLPEISSLTIPAALPAPQGEAPSWSGVGWLAFATDLAFEAGVTATEFALLGFGTGFASLGGGGLTPGLGAYLGLGLVLLLHPLADALIVNAFGRIDRGRRTDLTVPLIGAYAGCLLGTGALVVALVGFGASLALGLVVGGLLNAAIPAAAAVLAQQLFTPPARGANDGALGAAEARPLLAWSL